tara:strand:- start:10514 stop:11659 length:1146 start_codon:yes stop_codon:yes gene_type:complete
MVSVFFPTNPNLSVAGSSVNRRSSNPLERAKELQNMKGKLGTGGFGGTNSAPLDELSQVFDSATNSIFDPKADSPMRELDRAQAAAPVARFPENIESFENFMKIIVLDERIFETTIGSASRNKSSISKKETIKLPLPSQLATTYAQGYKQEGLGVAGAVAGPEVGKLIQKARAGGFSGGVGPSQLEFELQEAGKNIAKKTGSEGLLAGGMGMLDEGGAIVAGAVGGGAIGTIAGAVTTRGAQSGFAQVGLARNPHMAVLYEAPNFRDFNFSWDLRPKNAKESDNLRKIIYKLKYYSHPDVSESDHLFTYPEQFALSFKKDEYLFKTRACVLTNVSIDYHGEGTPLYYDRGVDGGKAPAAIKLDLTFTETRVLKKADINAGM